MYKKLKIFLMAFAMLLLTTNLLYAADLSFRIELFDSATGKAITANTQKFKAQLFITNNSADTITFSKFQYYRLNMSRMLMGSGYWKAWNLPVPDIQTPLTIEGYNTVTRSLGTEFIVAAPTAKTDPNAYFFPEKYSTDLYIYITTPTINNKLISVADVTTVVMP